MLKDFISFLNESWTAYHATAEARRRLLKAGFVELDEAQPTHDVKVSCLFLVDGSDGKGGKLRHTRLLLALYSFVARLTSSHLTIEHASLSRRSTAGGVLLCCLP